MAFCLYHYPRSPFAIGSYVVSGGLISVLMFKTLPKDDPLSVRILTFLILGGFVFAVLGGIFALSVVLSVISRKNRTFLTEHTITLDEVSFTEESPFNRTEQKWISVQKLGRTRKHLFIYISQHAAHVVPRRAFRDNAEWNAFYEYCKLRTAII